MQKNHPNLCDPSQSHQTEISSDPQQPYGLGGSEPECNSRGMEKRQMFLTIARPSWFSSMHRTLNRTSCSHRVDFVWPSGTLLDEKLHLSAVIVCGSAAIVCGSSTVVWPSVGIVFASAFDWLLTNSGPPSHEIQNFIFVCPSDFKFGTVWRQH